MSFSVCDRHAVVNGTGIGDNLSFGEINKGKESGKCSAADFFQYDKTLFLERIDRIIIDKAAVPFTFFLKQRIAQQLKGILDKCVFLPL